MTDRAAAAISKGAGGPDPLIGRVINERFKITGLIARGGMGKVYRAEQAPIGRVCALKVLNPNYSGEHDPEFHKRFFLEASLTSKLTHPNTVTIFDYGRTDDDIYYMAMEHLEGHTLHRAIREAGHFPEERTAHVARQICRALREAHALGVIHRDLKPANIFLVEHGDESDFVKVLDFGLVKNVVETKGEELTKAGLFMGSPKYMAPEQISGEKVDVRTDVYALGVIMYEMVTGKVPFDSSTSVDILMAQVKQSAIPLSQMNPNAQASPELEETIARCMRKSPDERFRSMDEVLAALKRVGAAATNGLVTGQYRTLSTSGSGPQSSPLAAGAVSGTNAVPAFLSPSPSDAGAFPAPLAVSNGGPPSMVPLLSQPPSAPEGSKGALLLGILGALVVAGALGYVALHPGLIGSAAQPAGPPVAAAPVAPEPTLAVSATLMAKVRVSTDPDGASVREDGVELCSSTPCDLLYKGPDADPSREHKLTFGRQGYRSETRSVKVTDARLMVKLAKVEVPRVVPQAVARPEAPALPNGYKNDVPY
ncbi:MAG: serine/threonine protein kinase [Polyangiaceae bacterium]|jgi:eukaryotic-like serine/threonine-protein kinase